jgi:hypothetical protein
VRGLFALSFLFFHPPAVTVKLASFVLMPIITESNI